MRDGATFVGPPGSGRPQAAPMLTNRATAVLAEATQLARRTHQDTVTTEHLLLALLAEAGAVPATLAALGIDRLALEQQLKAIVASATPSTASPGTTPSLSTMRHTLELAEAEARLMVRPLGPEHLLLALLAQDEGGGPPLLRAGGASLEAARAALART